MRPNTKVYESELWVRVELEAQYRAVDISNANSKNIQTGDIRCPQYQYSSSSLQYLHPNTTFLLEKKRSRCIGINSSRNREETNKMKKVTLKIQTQRHMLFEFDTMHVPSPKGKKVAIYGIWIPKGKKSCYLFFTCLPKLYILDNF